MRFSRSGAGSTRTAGPEPTLPVQVRSPKGRRRRSQTSPRACRPQRDACRRRGSSQGRDTASRDGRGAIRPRVPPRSVGGASRRASKAPSHSTSRWACDASPSTRRSRSTCTRVRTRTGPVRRRPRTRPPGTGAASIARYGCPPNTAPPRPPMAMNAYGRSRASRAGVRTTISSTRFGPVGTSRLPVRRRDAVHHLADHVVATRSAGPTPRGAARPGGRGPTRPPYACRRARRSPGRSAALGRGRASGARGSLSGSPPPRAGDRSRVARTTATA